MFHGIRIVELAQYIFVPAATALLADQGAEVIKVEAPGGDPYRTLKVGDGRETASANLALEQNNRGKKSIVLDLKRPEGRDALLRILDSADVFVTSLRPAALERLGLDAAALRARNPRLIYARANGVGFRGPDAGKAGFDASSFWARGGFADLLMPDGAPAPARTRPALGDHASAMSFAFGIVAALFYRERTGVARLVETSLLANAAWILSADLAVACAKGGAPGAPAAGKMTPLPLQRAYRTADDRWVQVMILAPDRHWPSFCHMIGLEAVLDDPLFMTMEGRIENGAALVARIAERIAMRPWSEWHPLFLAWDGAWELVQGIAELSADPQLRSNDMLFDVKADDGTPVTLVSGPVAYDGHAAPPSPRRAPRLDEHGAQLLADAGYAESEIVRMRSAGVMR
ncbi:MULTISPECIES: CaiB/BaiF CoA transferase family protein [unclassified Sphingobium]|uniref:CaiB/BaiF CoA transferase family protein n=1 Tax=unclassified Sphingobium TaxID=2611147 RepID=UPI00119A0C29|nr:MULTISPECIES: CoA transferase [unclassified Sphingobium]MBG6120115.1 crotonobetainyl-CoA:carnitine CoA-transferase CaiB-like acyl-CoA transferase [Sphingobium sp. JAI105]TWD05684.1 crotonobetainyl-CoA:carnitine CoA-transferase CaiB-like acyl-CoA transferase [Sphingobium sp. AEW010]TWD23237.1 crotonobetainyl-CoA:carnitine CoA-transferase CaiB-like acyl-CoA transferase [Sphingobium sp. AEW013]TWD25097.1 crotonobetainyl-CoA:carnitine CoA-transferase CaiB-like acyl-CoA transferase [Sphingobium s